MTSSTEIIRMLRNKHEFLGCFSHSKLIPSASLLPFLPKYLIINTISSHTKVGHWVVIYMKSVDEVYYFDPLCEGQPRINRNIKKFLFSVYKNVYCNAVSIQSKQSSSCGLFCILFVRFVKTRDDYINFISMFKRVHLKENDKIVTKLLFGQ